MSRTGHRHEFHATDESPAIEDFAAIWHLECQHRPVVGRTVDHARDEVYEQGGEKCGETRRVRFDPRRIILPSGDEVTVPPREEWVNDSTHPLYDDIEAAIDAVESADNDGTLTITDIDPDETAGRVRVEADGYVVIYRP